MGRINEPTAWHRAVVVLRFTSHKDGTADSECIAREILPPPPNQVLERSDSLWATGFVVQLPPSPTFLVRECWSATTTLHSQKARADRNRRCSLLKPSWNFARQNVQSISSTDDQAADKVPPPLPQNVAQMEPFCDSDTVPEPAAQKNYSQTNCFW